MGYGLPAAVGLCIASGCKETICLEGDGSIMMNLQELQTIVTSKLPVKIFLINNEGYHSIRQTQNNLFKEHSKVGIGPESNDLSFPSYEKLAKAFGYPYFGAHSNAEMKTAVEKTLAVKGFAFCEIFTDTRQVWEPKSSTKRLPDGRLVSPPLEDLAPFLSAHRDLKYRRTYLSLQLCLFVRIAVSVRFRPVPRFVASLLLAVVLFRVPHDAEVPVRRCFRL